MVQLRVIVTDRQGAYIRNLARPDFHVFENGVEQEIRAVATPSQPEASTNVLILLDTSNQMYETFPYLEDSVADFIRELAPPDAVALFSFSRNMVRLSPLTQDRRSALAGLRNAVLGDRTALYNSMLLALREAERMNGSKALVVFSNGADGLSLLTPNDIRVVAEDDGVPIYAVSANTEDHDVNLALRNLTDNTGGRVYLARDWRKQKAAFESIDRDLNNSYRIDYYPSSNSGDGYRKIEVRIGSDPSHVFEIHTRDGYRPSR
jgi:Ca-activated chloride channel family protein